LGLFYEALIIMKLNRLRHFDLFSGYGGFTLALERIYGDYPVNKKGTRNGKNLFIGRNKPGFKHGAGRSASTQIIGFSEIDEYASAILKYRWPNVKNYGNITRIKTKNLPDFDLLTGGSPCQDLSIAGKRRGLSGERSGLFYHFIRILKDKKPKYFIWENVKGAMYSNKGRDFALILNQMADCGYSLWWQILNAKDFGVPQNRERIFVVGFRDKSAPEVFFERKDGEAYNGKTRYSTQDSKPEIGQALRRYGVDGIGPALKHNPTNIKIPVNTKKGYDIARSGDSINFAFLGGKDRQGRVGHGVAQTLDLSMQQYTPVIAKTVRVGGKGSPIDNKQNWMNYKINNRVRRLTPIECERLMGLPDGWTKYAQGKIGDKTIIGYKDNKDKTQTIPIFAKSKDGVVVISDSQRYKLCGNGVVVNVVEEIIKRLIL
jgi:DNA (cytosine-5)-methyltransferase 1